MACEHRHSTGLASATMASASGNRARRVLGAARVRFALLVFVAGTAGGWTASAQTLDVVSEAVAPDVQASQESLFDSGSQMQVEMDGASTGELHVASPPPLIGAEDGAFAGSSFASGVTPSGTQAFSVAAGQPDPLAPIAAPPGQLGPGVWFGPPPASRPLLQRLHTWIMPVRPDDYETWLHRPFSLGWYAGFVHGTPLVDDWLAEGAGFWGGYRLGWDYDAHWGAETRLGLGSVRVWDSAAAKAEQTSTAYDKRDSWLWQWDLVLLYYQRDVDPWRPYLLWGVGLAGMKVTDRLDEDYSGTYFAMPIGLGVKFRRQRWLAFRVEFVDNIVFPNDLNTTHHWSLNAGLEYRFGGSRRTYWPWVPGRSYLW
ncbi:MAG: hypothetical protein D6741_01890 [Planctomycetota bacterium]|nr:MAG: hypothetical protein D6741_01890 [Planctomycetota bacterium]